VAVVVAVTVMAMEEVVPSEQVEMAEGSAWGRRNACLGCLEQTMMKTMTKRTRRRRMTMMTMSSRKRKTKTMRCDGQLRGQQWIWEVRAFLRFAARRHRPRPFSIGLWSSEWPFEAHEIGPAGELPVILFSRYLSLLASGNDSSPSSLLGFSVSQPLSPPAVLASESLMMRMTMISFYARHGLRFVHTWTVVCFWNGLQRSLFSVVVVVVVWVISCCGYLLQGPFPAELVLPEKVKHLSCFRSLPGAVSGFSLVLPQHLAGSSSTPVISSFRAAPALALSLSSPLDIF
jgi:hypothetical protein